MRRITLMITYILALVLIPNGARADEAIQIDGEDVMTIADLFPTCRRVNGLLWCYSNDACGEACNAVCARMGSMPIEDNTVWFEAQDTEGECDAIALAFASPGQVGSFQSACLTDGEGGFGHPLVGLAGVILCSTQAGCPMAHRTLMDQLGVPCESTTGVARKSICPCKTALARFPE